MDLFQKCQKNENKNTVSSTGIYPYFKTIEGYLGSQVICDGRRKIMLASGNYLGLAHDERVLEASQAAVRKYGTGCTGSRLLSGINPLLQELEQELAVFLKKEAVLLFSTGYLASQALIFSLLESESTVFFDDDCHPSIKETCSFSKARMRSFSQGNLSSLEKALAGEKSGSGILLLLEAIKGLTGEITPVKNLAPVAKKYQARVVLDETHSLGILGSEGGGVCTETENEPLIDIVFGTFSLAIGANGGFIAGPKSVMDYIKSKARSLWHSSTLPPASVGAALKSILIIREEPELRAKLWHNVELMKKGLSEKGFQIGATNSPILPVRIGSDTLALKLSEALFEAGIYAGPAVHPIVPEGKALLRVVMMACHSDEEIEYVVDTCYQKAKALGILPVAPYSVRKEGKEVLNYDKNSSVPDQERISSL